VVFCCEDDSGNPESTDISPFNFEGTSICIEVDEGGVEWFNANSVCGAMAYTNPRNALKDHVLTKDVSKRYTLTAGGKQLQNFVNESGLYSLILGSEKPEAKRFKHWVTSKVLPAIRKTGRYEAPRQESQPPSDALAIAREQHKVIGILLDEVGTLKANVDEVRDGLAALNRGFEELRQQCLKQSPGTVGRSAPRRFEQVSRLRRRGGHGQSERSEDRMNHGGPSRRTDCRD
jgi:prophage antirepressor-like protein